MGEGAERRCLVSAGLLPCPFCGGEAAVDTRIEDQPDSGYAATCMADEPCAGSAYRTNWSWPTVVEAIAAWNRRAAQPVGEQQNITQVQCPHCKLWLDFADEVHECSDPPELPAAPARTVEVAVEWLERRRRAHYDCEDCWYSCATLTCDEQRRSDKCDCGADTMNAEIDAMLQAALQNVAPQESVSTVQSPARATVATPAGAAPAHPASGVTEEEIEKFFSELIIYDEHGFRTKENRVLDAIRDLALDAVAERRERK